MLHAERTQRRDSDEAELDYFADFANDWKMLGLKLNLGTAMKPEYLGVRLDLKHRTVVSIVSGGRESLTNDEYDILWAMVRAQGNLLTLADIDILLRTDLVKPDALLDNSHRAMISKIRSKLRRISGNTVRISNFPGRGYCLASTGAEDQETN